MPKRNRKSKSKVAHLHTPEIQAKAALSRRASRLLKLQTNSATIEEARSKLAKGPESSHLKSLPFNQPIEAFSAAAEPPPFSDQVSRALEAQELRHLRELRDVVLALVSRLP